MTKLKRTRSSFSLEEFYPKVFQEEAYNMEAEVKKIMISKLKINKRYVGMIICAVIAGIILIIVLGLTFIGAIIAVLLAICLIHIFRKAWKRYRFKTSNLSKERLYEMRLSCLNQYLKTLRDSKISLKDLEGIMEKVFQDFLPALVLQMHNPKLQNEVQILLKFLKSDAVHSCMLNSAIQLELSIVHNENPVITSARLRKFFIPVMHLLKQPPQRENQELEIVRRISEILSKEETQVLLLTHHLKNDALIQTITPFWTLLESNKETQAACTFIADIDYSLNPVRRGLSSKLLHYRRNSEVDLGKKFPRRKRHLFSTLKRMHETFSGVVKLDETEIEDYKHHASPSTEKLNAPRFTELSHSPLPAILPKTFPMLFDGDFADLNKNSSMDLDQEMGINNSSDMKSRDNEEDNSIVIRFHDHSVERVSDEEPFHVTHPYLECFEHLLAIEREPANEKLWKLVVNKPETKVYQRKAGDSPICMIKAYCQVQFSARTVYTAIWDTSIRTRWDAVFNEFRLIDTTPEYEVLYYMIKTPFGITRRDWLQRRVEIHDYPEPGTIIMHFCSMEHPAMPHKKGVIRAETLVSGYVIRPTGENTCNVMIVSQNDIKGLIPKVLVNSVASKAPADWVNSMNKGCRMVLGLN